MDYKQKYKEALTWVESIYHELSHDRQMEAEAFFPELKESEDEKIRKEILLFCQGRANNYPNAPMYGNIRKWIAWLEKQGEQKPITFNNAHVINSALNDYCCKQYNALHKENGGFLSFARLQHLAMDIYGWCKEQDKRE